MATKNEGLRRRAVLLAVIVLAWPAVGRSAELLVPPDVQATMAVRVLEYDRGLKAWAGTALVAGVVARKTDVPTVADMVKEMTGRDAQGLPIKGAEHAYRDVDTLKTWIERAGVRLLYVAPDMGADSAAVLSASAARKLPTLVATRAQFESGAALGIVVKDGRPRILVNLTLARAAGMDLDSKLLQLSEVVR